MDLVEREVPVEREMGAEISFHSFHPRLYTCFQLIQTGSRLLLLLSTRTQAMGEPPHTSSIALLCYAMAPMIATSQVGYKDHASHAYQAGHTGHACHVLHMGHISQASCKGHTGPIGQKFTGVTCFKRITQLFWGNSVTRVTQLTESMSL